MARALQRRQLAGDEAREVARGVGLAVRQREDVSRDVLRLPLYGAHDGLHDIRDIYERDVLGREAGGEVDVAAQRLHHHEIVALARPIDSRRAQYDPRQPARLDNLLRLALRRSVGGGLAQRLALDAVDGGQGTEEDEARQTAFALRSAVPEGETLQHADETGGEQRVVAVEV